MCIRKLNWALVICVLSGGLSGCGSASFPEYVEVALPTGATQKIPRGMGASALANTKWEFFPTDEEFDFVPPLTLSFDELGGVTRIDNYEPAVELIGETVFLDGTSHQAVFSGASYSGATYGGAVGSVLVYQAYIKASVLGVTAVTASVTIIAESEGADYMAGTVSLTSQSTLGIIPEIEIRHVPFEGLKLTHE